MNIRSTPEQDPKQTQKQERESLPEKIARFVDPPGREVSDDELSDPGANIPDSRPGEPEDPKRKPIVRR